VEVILKMLKSFAQLYATNLRSQLELLDKRYFPNYKWEERIR